MLFRAKHLALCSSFSLLVACNGGGGGGGLSINSNIISGVAATGAPIPSGKVEIRGKGSADPVETTTSSDGSYSANISSLEEPYLVRVVAPSGEKYISVATQSALAEGKKINITPISNLILANVLGKSNVDEVFEGFDTISDDFSEEKLELEKGELLDKFIQAGLLGDNGVAGSNIDLLNGTLVAGSSDGLDGLLDILDIEGDSDGFEIKLKGQDVPFVVDKIDGTDDGDIDLTQVNVTSALAQISVIEAIRIRMNALAASYSSFAGCAETPVDDGSHCDIDTIYSTIAPYFHSEFQQEGSSSVWGWICEDDASSKETCTEIEFSPVQLKDITLVKFNDVTQEALISFNIYFNNKLKSSEEILLKKEGDVFKVLGNKKSFRYWIQSSSEHLTESKLVNGQVQLVNKYQVNLNFGLDDRSDYSFNGTEVFTLTALSGNPIFPGVSSNSATMSLYVVKYPHREFVDGQISCDEKFALSVTDKPYQSWDNGTTTALSYSEACPGTPTNVCDCPGINFDFESTRLVLSEEQVSNMSKFERISMTKLGVTDEFVIKKPLVINQFNAAQYIPQIGVSAQAFCQNTSNPGLQFNLTSPIGDLSFASIYYGLHNGSYGSWTPASDELDFHSDESEDVNQTTFSPNFESDLSGLVIDHRSFYVQADDDLERTFVRRINCSTVP